VKSVPALSLCDENLLYLTYHPHVAATCTTEEFNHGIANSSRPIVRLAVGDRCVPAIKTAVVVVDEHYVKSRSQYYFQNFDGKLSHSQCLCCVLRESSGLGAPETTPKEYFCLGNTHCLSSR
jgi:hypothetical protein